MPNFGVTLLGTTIVAVEKGGQKCNRSDTMKVSLAAADRNDTVFIFCSPRYMKFLSM
jgi:hypothetical protein